MDINRVELKGRVSVDVTTRKTANNAEWISFAVVTNEYNPNAKVEKDKSIPTYTSVSVFNTKLVEKIKKVGLHVGNNVWLVGKLMARNVFKDGRNITYTTVVASELEILYKKQSGNNDITRPSEKNNENDDF